MNHKRLLLQMTDLMLALLLLVACGSPLPTPTATVAPILPTPTPAAAAIREIVREAGKVMPLADAKDEITTTTAVEGNYKNTYEKHDVVDNIDSIVYLGLNDDVIWPGNLVRGDRAHDFIYEPISVDRGPVILSISLESSSTGASIVQQVNDPKLSTVRQGISDLLKKAITADTRVPAKAEFTYQQIYNESLMNRFVGADVSYGAGSLNTRFDWDSAAKKNKIMAKYRQIYYSIDIDPPTSPAGFFAPSMTVPEIAAAMPAGSKPLYVAGVSYGMMALMFIETDYTEEQMKMALGAAYEGIVDAKLDFGYSAKEVLQSSNIQIVVYGGSTAGLHDLETGYAGFKRVIEASKDFGPDSPGVPLVYKFRHLSDNTMALVTLTSQYTLVKPLRIRQRVRVTVDRFDCYLSDDEGANNDADMDRFTVWVNAFSRKDVNDPPVQINPVDQKVYEWWTAKDETLGEGATHPADGGWADLVFDTENYDFSLATIKLKAWAREYDTSSANEEGSGNYEIPGDRFLENGGKHSFKLTDNSDFGFDVWVTIELMD